MNTVVLWSCLAAGLSIAQAPDPHENPVIQNAPSGKKEPANVGPATSPVERSRSIPATTEAPATPAASAPTKVVAPPVLENLMLGEWQLDVAESKFEPGPSPKSEVRTYKTGPTGIIATISRVDADGVKTEISYPWIADGAEHEVTGSALADRIQLTQIDNLTAEATLRHAGKTIATARRSLSADGKQMLVVFTDTTSDERPVKIRAVYYKVASH